MILYYTKAGLLSIGSLVYKVHKLVEFRCDDNLSTAVSLLTHLSIIARKRIILATASCC